MRAQIPLRLKNIDYGLFHVALFNKEIKRFYLLFTLSIYNIGRIALKRRETILIDKFLEMQTNNN